MNDGGPAFPRPLGEALGTVSDSFTGMTLRDYFAAAALPALIAAAEAAQGVTRKDVAGEAYHYADDMLSAREATK